MIASYNEVLLLSVIVFLLGAVCAASRRNLIMILIGVEIMLNAAGITLVGASLRWNILEGQVFVIFIMALAAAEVSIGLALIIYSHKRTGSVNADTYSVLRG
ncbi:MAG: NADH-quinone oxidoreductase subunit NuoK [Syntrophobacteraceae bacterium]